MPMFPGFQLNWSIPFFFSFLHRSIIIKLKGKLRQFKNSLLDYDHTYKLDMTYDEELLSYRMMLTLNLIVRENTRGRKNNDVQFELMVSVRGEIRLGFTYISLVVYGFGV